MLSVTKLTSPLTMLKMIVAPYSDENPFFDAIYLCRGHMLCERKTGMVSKMKRQSQLANMPIWTIEPKRIQFCCFDA